MLSFPIHFEVLPTPGELNNKINIYLFVKNYFGQGKNIYETNYFTKRNKCLAKTYLFQ